MEKNICVPFYRTVDFEEAFTLSSANAILVEVEWDYKGEVGTFVFEDEDGCRSILEKHRRKQLKLFSHDVLFSYRTLKNELFRAR